MRHPLTPTSNGPDPSQDEEDDFLPSHAVHTLVARTGGSDVICSIGGSRRCSSSSWFRFVLDRAELSVFGCVEFADHQVDWFFRFEGN
ncbi:hypothetical protein L6452_34313 [Arctium lappa]|uniref:Uncharacterized protein n=1 Tax=Arctium lappa TaxID=4217 RepID=A0ACB8YJ13_ARCLA|nr:hypothetical protein L6452_34313 [Arctium lappa]